MADDGDCARCCFRFVLTAGLSALFLWLSLRTYKPTLFIQDFSVPALNVSHNSTNNHTIFFSLTLRNQMKDKGVAYANISLTFLYNSSLLVANYTVPAFKQGHDKTAHRKEAVEAAGLPWPEALAGVSNGSVSFRVRAATRVRSRIIVWLTKSHALVVTGDVAVDASGRKVNKKSIKLKSAAPDLGGRWVGMGPVALFTFFIISVN